MLALLSRFTRSRTNPKAASPAPRRAAFEPLEDRRLCSVSPVATTSFSWGATNTGLLLPAVQASREAAATSTQLPAVQQPASTNIIGILIAL